MSPKIFKDVLPPSVFKNPEKVSTIKCATIPLNVFACSFVYYLLASANLRIDIYPKFYSRNEITDVSIENPVVYVSHDKSRRSSKNNKLEYVTVDVILLKSKKHRDVAGKVAELLNSKLFKMTQDNLKISGFDDIYKIRFGGFLKTFVSCETIDFD